MKQVSTVVTDLDNTLYDWVRVWYESFHPMFRALVEITQLPEDTLAREIRAVHQRHGTSEYAFLLQELPSLQQLHPGDNLAALYEGVISAYREGRSAALKLYPSVRDTLIALKSRGCLTVAYTESMAFYTNYRIRKLGLDGLLDYVYRPRDHGLPEGMNLEDVRRYPPDHYKLRATTSRHTPEGALKPNPDVLLSILQEVGADPKATVYVGDSLMKDVAMAQGAGVADVFAQYGTAHQREEYDLLRRVSHWSEADVQREKRILSSSKVAPTHVLECGFAELLQVVEPLPR